MKRRVGILGGTFDPVHIGHLRAAVESAEALGLDELRLIPSAAPPHRAAPEASATQRLAMVQLAVADEPSLQVDDRELQRDTLSYSIDTLISLREELGPEVLLYLLLGWDAYCGLASWYRWQELLDYCHIAVMQRPDATAQVPAELLAVQQACSVEEGAALQVAKGHICFIWQAPLAVSATQIRQRLKNGKSVRFLLPEAVLTYIQTQGLYSA